MTPLTKAHARRGGWEQFITKISHTSFSQLPFDFSSEKKKSKRRSPSPSLPSQSNSKRSPPFFKFPSLFGGSGSPSQRSMSWSDQNQRSPEQNESHSQSSNSHLVTSVPSDPNEITTMTSGPESGDSQKTHSNDKIIEKSVDDLTEMMISSGTEGNDLISSKKRNSADFSMKSFLSLDDLDTKSKESKGSLDQIHRTPPDRIRYHKGKRKGNAVDSPSLVRSQPDDVDIKFALRQLKCVESEEKRFVETLNSLLRVSLKCFVCAFFLILDL